MRHTGQARSFIGIAILASVLVPHTALAQVSTRMPVTVPLSDVQMQLATGGGDGCLGRCVDYRITIRGTGSIELEDFGTPPRAATKRRSLTNVGVVGLLNEFLKVRFFDAVDRFDVPPSYVLQGDSLSLRGSGGTGKYVDLTLRLGTLTKTVRLKDAVPAEWDRLQDILWRTGGPDAWPSNQ